ncbi:MAG: protein kinase domain-containing protein [Planctomycetota bacterium]
MNDTGEKDDRQSSDEEAIPTASFGSGMVGIGEQIGRYKLLRILGEGGFGIVYLAVQQRPMKRQVALKIIKPGMDSAQVIRRFEAERQALALLDHPNVAHVFDAGTTKFGRPYFVMEYVKGIPITEHCDRQKLTIEERLKLFVKVCEAIQHAHQKGIIHRDIKPSNIQVSIQDEQFVPKVIDFGVAKALTQPLTERTLVTEAGQMLGTPEYISPEQAEMTNQDIDTRSDIYSLGVLLYELLTGILPFESKVLRKGSLEQMRQVIREEEPKTPSTRLSSLDAEASIKLAKCCRSDTETLRRKLHGDLDWITLKAMDKDRIRRYQTAHALAEDIERHLNHEPVLAGPPSKIYRLKKLIRKHRSQAIGTAVAGILLILIAVISVMYMKAANRSKEAESLEDKNTLSNAQEYSSKGQFQEALAELETVLDSEYVGPEARCLHARTVLKLQGPTEAIGQLKELTKERDEIACQAHFLLARIYLETDPGDLEDISEYLRKGKFHQQEGEKLFSKSPEAYFNRSMMVGTVKSVLEWLDKALELDPGHYDSLEAQSLAYYALKEYDKMEAAAYGMIVKESKNSRGYALRAIARREKAIKQHDKELFGQAIKDHNEAIRLSPDDTELYDQRRRTYIRMANYAKALADAQQCIRLKPNNGKYHFHVFCALVSLGRYDEAQDKYDTITKSNLMEKYGRDGIHQAAEEYVFDALDAGLSWHPHANEPNGAAFLSMVWADEDYHRLAEKGKMIVPEGFAPDWSPDGDKLIYSRGVCGYSGIEIFNLKTRETRLLTASGFDPSWSPDGLYIAFVRGRRTLLLADLAAEHPVEEPPNKYREIWLIEAEGTEEPRFLTKGHKPYWSRDSKRILYYLPEDKRIYSISIEEESEPQEIIWCPGGAPMVSPDEKFIAFSSGFPRSLRVMDRHSGSLVASWYGPWGIGFVNWSSDGRKLTVAGYWESDLGLWIYDRETREASNVLSGRITRGRLSPPDDKRMAIAFGPPLYEIWVADTESLGRHRTIEEHYRELVNRFSRRIEFDPGDAENYYWRAIYSITLGDKQRVLEDLKKYSDIEKSPSKAAQIYDVTAWSLVGRHQQMVDPEIAVEIYNNAHKMQPKDWRYLRGLGTAHYRTGQWQEAITSLTKSIELDDGENALNYLLLAMTHWQLGSKNKAINWYNKAMAWIEKSNFNWRFARTHMIYDIYLEASELMDIEIRPL